MSRHGDRRLRSHLPLLLRDIFAVASGLRAGFLLDYGIVEAKYLADDITGILQLLPKGHQLLCVVVVAECCLVVAPKALDVDHPMLLRFHRDGDLKSLKARWASPAEGSEIRAQFIRLKDALVSACAEGFQKPRVPIVQLDSVPNLPTIPTVHGFLLGYPIVYVVSTLEEAQAANRCLSTSTLRVYKVICSLEDPDLHSESSKKRSDVPLLGFSLPAALADGSQAWTLQRQRWSANLYARHAEALMMGYRWRSLTIQESSCMAGVIL